MNTIVWVDIPVLDIERARRFYSALLDMNLEVKTHNKTTFVPFLHKDDEVAGCLVEDLNFQASQVTGPLVYLNVHGRLDDALQTINEHGGKILERKEEIKPWGYRAIIMDSEGNRIALHSN